MQGCRILALLKHLAEINLDAVEGLPLRLVNTANEASDTN